VRLKYVEKDVTREAFTRGMIRQSFLDIQIAQAINAPQPVFRVEEEATLNACRASFLAFLPFWQFVNRESGQVHSFASLWTGQRNAANLMESEPWLYLLKAGKLGFTELECAYDAWVALFRQPNAFVGIFSRDNNAAKKLLTYVKFGLAHLPAFMRPPIFDGPGGDTTQSIILAMGQDDLRTIMSYSTKTTAAIDVSLTHAHLDELSHILDPETLWGDVSTVIAPAPYGSCHVVTRGRGANVYTARMWEDCKNLGGQGRLYGHFEPWSSRDDRDERWYLVESASRTVESLNYYAPQTPEEALAAEGASEFVPLTTWDMCEEQDLPALVPGSRESCVLGLDAAVSNDYFAAVLVTRHPKRHEDVAVRHVWVWKPQDFPGKRIDFTVVEEEIRKICTDFKVVCAPFDAYQLEQMSQRLLHDHVVWADPFSQAGDRMLADAGLRQLILNRRIAHGGQPAIRDAIRNAAAKMDAKEDTKLRIVKAGSGKIDPLVALSMAASRCLYLVL
jgi:hypothetical protein